MPSEKRQRQDQGRLLRLEEQRTAQQQARRSSSLRVIVLVVLGIVAIGAIIAFLPGKDKKDDVATEDSSALAIPIPDAGASLTGETPCPEADGSSERTTTFAKAPPTCIDAAKTYTAVISTSEGDITVALDATAAPVTVNNFVVLARYHYFDGVAFHRIIPGFMDQTGDATGPSPGQGDPGYSIPDELPTGDAPYPTGSVVMANSGPDSGGSQFFITVEGGAARLAPTYSRFGSVTKGQDVVDTINSYGTNSSNGEPTKLVTITDVTITES